MNNRPDKEWLEWSSEPPKVAGWYSCDMPGYGVCAIRVFQRPGDEYLGIFIPGEDHLSTTNHGAEYIPVSNVTAQWAGPIPGPIAKIAPWYKPSDGDTE